MKTWQDVWNYLCGNGYARECAQFKVNHTSDAAIAFWHGVLTVLECEGKVSGEDSDNIWNEITNG